MSKQEFEDFLSKEEEKSKPAIDWEVKKNWWLKMLDILYQDIQNWLSDYIKNGQITIKFEPIEILEEAIGFYTAKQMKIQIGYKVATLIPVGTILIGTNGRVDMKGDFDIIRIILADKKATKPEFRIREFSTKENLINSNEENIELKSEIDWAWKLTTDPPFIKYIDLNEETFLKSLIQVCNG